MYDFLYFIIFYSKLCQQEQVFSFKAVAARHIRQLESSGFLEMELTIR